MNPGNTPRTEETGQRLLHTALLFASGLGILGFCVAIDHPQWFRIRPVSGTAVAMARASEMSKQGTSDRERAPKPSVGVTAAVASE